MIKYDVIHVIPCFLQEIDPVTHLESTFWGAIQDETVELGDTNC